MAPPWLAYFSCRACWSAISKQHGNTRRSLPPVAAFTPSHLSLIFSSSFLHCHCHILKIEYFTQLNWSCFVFSVGLFHTMNFSCTFLLSTGIALKWLEGKAVTSDELEVLTAVEIPPSYYNGWIVSRGICLCARKSWGSNISCVVISESGRLINASAPARCVSFLCERRTCLQSQCECESREHSECHLKSVRW